MKNYPESFVFRENKTSSGIEGFISNNPIKKKTIERIIAKSKLILVGCLTL